MEYLLEENPRRRHRRRNPGLSLPMVGSTRSLLGGVDIMEAGVGAGAAIASALIAGKVVKPRGTSALTAGQKWLRVAVGVGVAIGAGFAARQLKMSPKTAILGGLIGTAVQAVTSMSRIKLQESGFNYPLALPLGESVTVPSQESEVGIITNVT